MVILLVLVLKHYDGNQAMHCLYKIIISLSFDGYTSLHRKCNCSHVRIGNKILYNQGRNFILFLLNTFYLLFLHN